MGQTNLVSAESIEKLIQIGQMSGNININGNFNQIVITVGENILSQIGDETFFSDVNYTDAIITIISEFDKNQLLDIDTYQEIMVLLYIHPNPEPSVNLLFAQRPIPDLISLTMWISYVYGVSKRIDILKPFGIDGDKKFQVLTKAFEKRHDFNRTTYSAKYILKITNQFMRTLWKDVTLAYDYIDSHPEILDFHVDQCLASFTVLDSEKMGFVLDLEEMEFDRQETLEFIQETRQFLHNIRIQKPS